MFEKIFTYSSIDKKENRISGGLFVIKMILFAFPVSGLSMGLFSCYVRYLNDTMYRTMYYVIAVLLILLIVFFVIRWINEMFTVYAIGKNGKIYQFKTFAFAVSYLGFGSKINEIAGKGGSKLAGTFELMMKVRRTIEKIDSEEKIEEMFAQGYVVELSEIEITGKNREGIRIKAVSKGSKISGKVYHTIRKVYDDWENLFRYLEYTAEEDKSEGFTYKKKTSYEDFMIEKPGYGKRVFRQSIWVLIGVAWLGMFMLSSDMNKQSKINAAIYQEAEAEVTEIQKSFVTIKYKVEKKEYENRLTSNDKKYQEGEKVEIYYEKENPEHYFIFAFDPHINYKPLMVIFLFSEVIILTVNISFKNKKTVDF